MQKYIIWPLIYKDRFREKKTIFYILFLILVSNYFLMLYWVNVFTNFEYTENKFFDFKNCQICLSNFEFRFSSNTLMHGLPFNIFFGMLIGMYLSNRNFLNIRIQWRSLTACQKFLKLFIYFSILSLEIFAFFPYFVGKPNRRSALHNALYSEFYRVVRRRVLADDGVLRPARVLPNPLFEAQE